MTDLAAYGPGYAGDSAVTALARLQQAWYRRDVLGVPGPGISPNTKQPLQSYLPEGMARKNFVTTCAYDYAEQRIADKAVEPDLTIVAGRLRHNMLSSQPMCFNLFADIRAEAAAGTEPRVHDMVRAMFPHAQIRRVDSVVVEEVPPPLPPVPAHDKTGWDAVIRGDDGQVLITIETKYTDHLDRQAPTRGNDVLFDVAEQMNLFTKDGLNHYRGLRRRPSRNKQDLPPPQAGGFDQLARNLLLTLRYAQARGIAVAVNYVLAPAFDTEAESLVRQLRGRLHERWRRHVQYRTLDDLVQSGRPLASPRLQQVFDDFTRRYLNLNPARQLLGQPKVAYPPNTGP